MDIESFQKENNVIPYCVCFILNQKEFYVYYDPKEDIIIKVLETICLNNDSTNIEIYVHNLNFDGMIIIEHISKKKINFTFHARKTNLYFLNIIYMNKNIRFRCSYKLIGVSLSVLGKLEKFKKLYFPYKFVNINNLFYEGKTPSLEYWEFNDSNINEIKKKIETTSVFNLKNETIAYCMNDVILTYRVLKNIIYIINEEDSSLLSSSYSAASLSFNLFFKKYNFLKISKKLHFKYDEYTRSSFYGGRVECFGNIKKGEYIKYFDFSGMYGQCMTEKFHNSNAVYKTNSNVNEVGFHTIEYESSNMNIPVLPFHGENGKLLFTNGLKTGTFWFEEINLFEREKGKVIKVLHSLVFDKYEKVFDQFITKFTKIKEKSGYYKLFGKLVINSLYGSMALKNEKEFIYFTLSENEFDSILRNMTISNFFKINNVYYLLIKHDYKSKKFFKNYKSNEIRNVSYSSAISSKARIKLFNAFKDVENDGGRVLYCDTDSIFAAYPIKDKREYFSNYQWIDFYEDGVFISPKTYLLKNEKEIIIKIKGVNVKKLNNKEEYEYIKNLFYKNKVIKFENQLIFKKKEFILKQDFISKEIWLNNYDKRIFINNKKESLPLTINSTVI